MADSPRHSSPGKRSRKDNGPADYQVEAVPPPLPRDIGQTTAWTEDIITGGPRALIAAERQAAELANRFGTEFEARWLLVTPWLKDQRPRGRPPRPNAIPHRDPSYLDPSKNPLLTEPGENAQRAYVRSTIRWRSRFLAVLALTHSQIGSARAAKTSQGTVINHRRADPDFDQQCLEAEEHAVQLLKDVVFRRALEGDCEPVFWQGIRVGYTRKFDGRLQVEMLRALMPGKFKTPGNKDGPTGAPINVENALICTPEVLQMIQSARQSNLKILQDARDSAMSP